MAERRRSVKGGRDSERVLGDVEAGPTEGGREGGNLARRIGVRDMLKRLFSRPAGATRVRKSDERGEEEDRRG